MEEVMLKLQKDKDDLEMDAQTKILLAMVRFILCYLRVVTVFKFNLVRLFLIMVTEAFSRVSFFLFIRIRFYSLINLSSI